MARRSEWRANLVATVVALAVLAAATFGVVKLWGNGQIFEVEDEEIAGYCDERALDRAEPGTSGFMRLSRECRQNWRWDPFG